jgi:hypothetical protein
MTTASDLAYRLEDRAAHESGRHFSSVLVSITEELPEILSALRRVEVMEKALKRAEQFIVNGTELGFIRMPETAYDPAHFTLPAIRQALTGEA